MRKYLLLIFSIGINCIYAQCPDWQARNSDPQSIPTQSTFSGNSTGWIINPETSDEFHENSIDLLKWSVKDQVCHGSSELSFYRTYNVSKDTGRLLIGFQREQVAIECGGYVQQYSAGWVELNNPVHYGYIEVKHKLPTDLNLVPCFWLWGAIPELGKCDEIDVGEYIFGHITDHTLNYNLYREYQAYDSKQLAFKEFTSSLTGQDIVYAVEWFPNEINFYINGQVVQCNKYTTDMRLVSPAGYKPISEYTCTNFTNMIAQKLQLSFTVMGNTNNFSQHYEVDYVRSYKL